MFERRLEAAQVSTLMIASRFSPGNRLEQLRGNRAGQHSTRINDQWRICFTWTAAGAADVEITNYH